MKKYKKPVIKKHGELRSVTFSRDIDVPERPDPYNYKILRREDNEPPNNF